MQTTTLPRCPVCNKTDPLTDDSTSCPRCGCDLTKSQAVYHAAQHFVMRAAAQLRMHEYDSALEHAAYAWSLAKLETIPPLACLAATMAQRFSDLALWQSRCNATRAKTL